MPKLLVFTVDDRPRHVGADRAMTALLGAFTFAPVGYRFHAEIPDLQLEQLPAAVDALRALADVESIAVVTLPESDEAPAEPTHDEAEPAGCDGAEPAGCDGAPVRRQP